MRKACLFIGILLIFSALFVNGVAAKQLQITSATGDFGTEIYLTGNESDQLCGYNLRIAWDPAVMNVTAVTNEGIAGNFVLNPTPPAEAGSLRVNYQTSGVNVANQTLIKLICNAKVFDGSSTNIYVDTAYNLREVDELVGGVPTDVWDQYTFVDGTFTTTDYTAPTISITTPTDGSTVSRTVNVAATITDVGGVDADSIEVCIGGVEVTPTLVPLVNGYTVTAQRENVPAGNNVQVQVYAEDLTGNSATRDHYVTVAEAGITFASPANGTYTNEAQPTILANFVKVNCTTLKMFINNVDVTASCDLTGVGPDGTIALNYTRYGPLADGAYHVVVNGTSSLVPGQEESDDVYFTKDTVAPVVSITGIDDSDGDGFPEAGEALCVHYAATDNNLNDVWFGGVHNTSRQASGCIDLTIATGNKEMVASASDLAGNIGYSAPVHIYNNNLAYFDDPSLGSFAGLDLTKTALYNVFTTAKAFTLTGPNAQMTVPTLGQLDKSITGGSNVTLDNRKDNPIPAGTLPSSIGIYTTPTGTLNFAVTVPNVTNATLMIAKANSTLIDQLISNPSRGSLTPGMLQDLLDSETIVLYGKGPATNGYAIVSIDASGGVIIREQVGQVSVSSGNMPKTIRDNYVDLSTGFNTATAPGLTPLQISDLGQGEYALLAVCMDNDRFGIISATTFEVTAQAGVLSTSAATYTIGQPVVVNSAVQGDALSAMVINSAATYTGNMTLDFSTLGKDSFKSAYLLANGNQTVEKLSERANIWLTKGYGNATASRNATSVSVPTSSLLPGTYRVYMFLENAGNVTSYSEATITLTTVTPTPSPTAAPYHGGGGGGGSSSAPASYTTTGTLLTSSSGTVLKSIIVHADDNVADLRVPIGVTALDADGKPISGITINPLTGDEVPAVPAGAVFEFAGYAYEAGPAGATFNPGITLTMEIPDDVWETLDPNNQQFTVKWYNPESGLWEEIQTTISPGTRTVTATITHFSTYALFTEPGTTPVTPTETATTAPTTTATTPAGEPPAEGLPMTTIVFAIVIIAIIAATGYYFFVMKK
jgi:hypothetical protein